MKNFEIKNQNGRSMIEMLGVLAIIGVLSVGGIAGYSKAMQRYRINKTIEQITLIAGNTRTFYSTQNNYDGLYGNVIKKAKLVPDEMLELKTDGTIKRINNPFGGILVLGRPTGSRALDVYTIYIGGIPQEACIELVTKDWGIAMPYAIAINATFNESIEMSGGKFKYNNCVSGAGKAYTTSSVDKGYITCGTTVPLETATTYCTSENNNTIDFAFH